MVLLVNDIISFFIFSRVDHAGLDELSLQLRSLISSKNSLELLILEVFHLFTSLFLSLLGTLSNKGLLLLPLQLLLVEDLRLKVLVLTERSTLQLVHFLLAHSELPLLLLDLLLNVILLSLVESHVMRRSHVARLRFLGWCL
mmetsp:Transcript_39659/g.60745  ORF Transcript_39659/g.60745 Transcript_39659/m.60745 type:complete len:142 (+) Transcript_39659:370-795(+)